MYNRLRYDAAAYAGRLDQLRSEAGIQGLQAFGFWLLGDALDNLPVKPSGADANRIDEEPERALLAVLRGPPVATATADAVDPWTVLSVLDDPTADLESLQAAVACWQEAEEAIQKRVDAAGPDATDAGRSDAHFRVVFDEACRGLTGADAGRADEIMRLFEPWTMSQGRELLRPRKRDEFDPMQHEIVGVRTSSEVPRDRVIERVRVVRRQAPSFR